jgi:hypothetical protein
MIQDLRKKQAEYNTETQRLGNILQESSIINGISSKGSNIMLAIKCMATLALEFELNEISLGR